MDIPDEAPALAAPPDIDQFRASEPAWVIEQSPYGYAGATDTGWYLAADPERVPAFELMFLDGVDYPRVLELASLVVDTRNALSEDLRNGSKAQIVRL